MRAGGEQCKKKKKPETKLNMCIDKIILMGGVGHFMIMHSAMGCPFPGGRMCAASLLEES